MPYRGRDTYYLELHLALTSLLLASMCFRFGDRYARLLFGNSEVIHSPVWLWGLLWLFLGVIMSIGILGHRPKCSEYGALLTAVLWCVVFYAALSSHLLYPLSTAVSPAFIIFSFKVYVYRTRLERARKRYGRLSYQ